MWYIKLLVTFMIGVTEIGCELCPENDGVKVVPVCTSGTVQGGAVAMSTENLPSLPELNCSCTIISYVVGDEPLPVLYYYGPGYSPCGIEYNVGGYRFSCFQGFIHFDQTSTEVHFTKNLPSSYPEACLLLLAGGPSTELRISCRKPDMVNTPLTTSSSTRKPVTTKLSTFTSGTSPRFPSTSLTSKTSSRNTTNLTRQPNLSVPSTDRTTLSSSKPISTFTNTVATPEMSNVTETSLTTDASNTSFVTDVTKTGRSSDVTKTSAMESSTVSNVKDTGRPSDVTKSYPLKSSSFTNVTDSHETRGVTKTSLVTDVVYPSTSPNVSYTSNTNLKTTLLKSGTTDTSVSTTASSLQSPVTTDTPSTEPSKTSETSPMTLSNVSVTTIRHNSNLSETNGTTGVRSTNHFSSRSSESETTERTSYPISANSTGDETGSTTIVVLLGKSRDEGGRTYVIVIATCCGILATLLIVVFVFLYNIRSRRRNKSIPRREHVGTTYTYIDAFKGDTITLLNEPMYFTATPVETHRHNDLRFETSSAAVDISTTPFSDTIVTPSQTDIYAIVTRRPPVFLTQPMKTMVSFKGPGSDQGKETPSGEQRRPVSQYGILQRRESAKLERKTSQTQRDRDGKRNARSQHGHFDIDMHAFRLL